MSKNDNKEQTPMLNSNLENLDLDANYWKSLKPDHHPDEKPVVHPVLPVDPVGPVLPDENGSKNSKVYGLKDTGDEVSYKQKPEEIIKARNDFLEFLRGQSPNNNKKNLDIQIAKISNSNKELNSKKEMVSNWRQDKKYYDKHVGTDKYVILDTGRFYTLDGKQLPTINGTKTSIDSRRYHKTEAQLERERVKELKKKLFRKGTDDPEENDEQGQVKNGLLQVPKKKDDNQQKTLELVLHSMNILTERVREMQSTVDENKAISHDINKKADELVDTTTELSAASFNFYETGEKAFKEIKNDVKNIVENTKNRPGVSGCSHTSVIGILYCIRGLIEILYSFLCILVFLFTKLIGMIRSGYYSIFIGPFVLIAFALDILIMMVMGFLVACLISHVGVMTGRPELLVESMRMITRVLINGTAALGRLIPTSMPKGAAPLYKVGEAMSEEFRTNQNSQVIVEKYNDVSEGVKLGFNKTVEYVTNAGASLEEIKGFSATMLEYLKNQTAYWKSQTDFFGENSTYNTVGTAFSSLFSTGKDAAVSGGRKERTRKRKTKRKTKKSSKIKKMKFTKRKNGLRKSKNGLRKSKRKGGNVIIIPKINPDSNIDFNELFSQDDNPELQKVMKSLADIGHLIKDMTDLKGVDFDRKPSKVEEEMFEKFKSMFDIVIPSTFSLMDMIHNTVNETPKNKKIEIKNKKIKMILA